MGPERLSILAALLLLSLSALRAQELNVWLNTNDCVNCTSALAQTHELDSAVAISINCTKGQERFIPSLLDGFGMHPGKQFSLHYVPRKRLLKHAPSASTCSFWVDNKAVLQFPLRALGTHVQLINSLSHNYTESTTLPLAETLPVSSRLQEVTYKNNLVLADYVTGKTLLVHLSATDSAHVVPLILPERWKRDHLLRAGKDSVRYDSTADILKEAGAFNPRVTTMNVSGDTLQLFVDVKYLDPDSTNGIIMSYPAFAELVDGKIVASWQCDWLMPQPLFDIYLMTTGNGFYIHDRSATIPICNHNPAYDQDSIYLFGDFTRVGYTSTLTAIRPETLPTAYCRQRPPSIRCTGGAIHGSTYRMLAYPFFVDLASDRSFNLSALLIPKHDTVIFENKIPQYWSHDAVLLDRNTLIVLYQWKGQAQVAWIDLKKKRIIRKVELATGKLKNTTLCFMEDGRVVGLDRNYNAVQILR